MFFTRWEQSYIQLISGSLNPGYGHEFEKAFTVLDNDLADSASHHRIIQYNLGGMNCIVRFEADAYFEDCPSSNRHSSSGISPTEKPANTENDLNAVLETLSLKLQEKDTEFISKKGVRAIQRGHLVPPIFSDRTEISTSKDQSE